MHIVCICVKYGRWTNTFIKVLWRNPLKRWQNRLQYIPGNLQREKAVAAGEMLRQEKIWAFFFNERQVVALAWWVQPSSYDPGLPPPPDFESPAWEKGPGANTYLAARRDGWLGGTALKRWRLCSGICQKLTTCKTRRLNYLQNIYSSQFIS